MLMIRKSVLRISLLVIALFICSMGQAVSYAAESSIGVLNIAKIINENPKIKEHQQNLNSLGKILSDNLEKEKANITAEEYQAKQKVAYNEFAKAKREYEIQIEKMLKTACEQVLKEKKLEIIVLKGSVLAGGIDVTNEVSGKIK